MPKLIHQIYISDDNSNPPPELIERNNQLKSIYSDYEYNLWNNTSIQDFLSKNFDSIVLDCYNKINAYSFKCDLARYCICYKLGGYYYDMPIVPEFKFEPIQPIMFVGTPSPNRSNNLPLIENSVLYFLKPNNNFLKQAIDKCVFNISNLLYNEHPLDITSPIMLGRLNTSDIILGKTHYGEERYSTFKNQIIFYHKPRSNGVGLKKYKASGTNNYEEIYFNHKIYNEHTISYIISTKNIKKEMAEKCIASVMKNCNEFDEVIIIGDNVDDINSNVIKIYSDKSNKTDLKNLGTFKAKGSIFIHSDGNMFFPSNFRKNLINFLNNNNVDVLTTKIILPRGGRWWDKIKYNGIDFELVEYNDYSENVLFNDNILIWKRNLARELKLSDIFSTTKALKSLGHKVIVDTNNMIIKFDTKYISVKHNNIKKVIKAASRKFDENEFYECNKTDIVKMFMDHN